MHTAALTSQIVMEGIGRGLGDIDFGALLEMQAANSGRELESEDAEDDVEDELATLKSKLGG